MSLQYLSDENGHVVAVQVPIEEWEQLKLKYPDIDIADYSLPTWQKELIDMRLKLADENPERILPISSLFDELDSNQD